MQDLLQTIVNGLLMGGIYSIASIGLTIIFGTIKIVNFAHGEFIMVGMYFTYLTWSLFGGLDPFIGMAFTLPAMFIFGAACYLFVIEPILMGKKNDASLIFATVGLSLFLQNVALLLFTANYRSVKTVYTGKALEIIGISVSVPRLLAFLVALVLSVLLTLFLQRTFIGKAIRASAQDRQVAMLMGINPRKVFVLTMGIGAMMAGVAGAVVMPFLYVFPSVGISFGLLSFVVAIVGGLGNLKGAFFCGLIIGVTEALGTHYITADSGLLLAFLLLVVVLIFRPEGLCPQIVRKGG